MKIFVTLPGQETNIGDVAHRKILLQWLKGLGELNLYIGSLSQSFVDGLELSGDYKLYRSLNAWLFQIVKSKKNNVTFLFNPGELRLGWQRVLGELLLLPFLGMVKLKKGNIIRVGVALNSPNKYTRYIMTKVIKFSNKVYWRTIESQKYFGFGEVIPDLAFYNYSNSEIPKEKKYLVISMRFNRNEPSLSWYEAIEKYAFEKKLIPICVTQVRLDDEHNKKIAKKLNCNHLSWEENVSHLQQEKKLIELYRMSAMVISDRLHVLILGCNEGANPVELLTENSSKVKDHFSVVGIYDNSLLIANKSETEINEFLIKQDKLVSNRKKAFLDAKELLSSIKLEITPNSKSAYPVEVY